MSFVESSVTAGNEALGIAILPTSLARPLDQPGPPAEKLHVLVLVPVAVPFSVPATAALSTRTSVTLLQRSPTHIMSLTHSVPRIIGNYAPDADLNRPDLEEQDRLFFATPTGPGEELSRRNAKVLEDLDRPFLEGLNARGLRTWRGQRGTGGATLGQTRNGGFYFDAGACEHIINGNTKVEPGYIERFTEDKVVLDGGREREFDLVVFATGFTNTIDSVRSTLGDKIADQCGPIRGIDEEGEFKTAYRETGVPDLWLMVGYLPYTRYHSKLLAARLKALKEGVASAPYTT
ncbi:hypothetical protein INS49_006111 [Diaporthe citri]|uniref:uncharacterized protein n=1 Tax=Diaporthe citri TaxID=83186 RepID=UPI001C8089DB|nr:uncharacterized protein INS49_006111 [Diaporthe citri]KAG6364510.1 hypothetical protein INS49_006111 [Diaporthe citri]